MKKIAVILILTIACISFMSCNFFNINSTDKESNGEKTLPPETEEFPPLDLDKTESKFYNLSYGNDDSQKLDVFLPNSLNDMTSNVPVILLIHGGSWKGGDKSNFYYISNFLNSYGYAAATINYRLITDGATYLDMLADITLALRFISDYANQLCLKNDKIALWGNSAGGHLALLYGYKMASVSPIEIALLISQVGPTDFTDQNYYTQAPSELGYRLNLISQLVGEELVFSDFDFENDICPKSVLDASPITHVGNNYVPTLLAYGEMDNLVPITNADRLYAKLQQYGNSVTCQLIKFPNSGHDLGNDADKTTEARLALAKGVAYHLPIN